MFTNKDSSTSMELRLFQALKAFKGADGCEANLFKDFKKIAEAAFYLKICRRTKRWETCSVNQSFCI